MGYGAEQEVNRRTTMVMGGQHLLLLAHSSNLFCFRGLTFIVLTHPPESNNKWPKLTVDDTTVLPMLRCGFKTIARTLSSQVQVM